MTFQCISIIMQYNWNHLYIYHVYIETWPSHSRHRRARDCHAHDIVERMIDMHTTSSSTWLSRSRHRWARDCHAHNIVEHVTWKSLCVRMKYKCYVLLFISCTYEQMMYKWCKYFKNCKMNKRTTLFYVACQDFDYFWKMSAGFVHWSQKGGT